MCRVAPSDRNAGNGGYGVLRATCHQFLLFVRRVACALMASCAGRLSSGYANLAGIFCVVLLPDLVGVPAPRFDAWPPLVGLPARMAESLPGRYRNLPRIAFKPILPALAARNLLDSAVRRACGPVFASCPTCAPAAATRIANPLPRGQQRPGQHQPRAEPDDRGRALAGEQDADEHGGLAQGGDTARWCEAEGVEHEQVGRQ